MPLNDKNIGQFVPLSDTQQKRQGQFVPLQSKQQQTTLGQFVPLPSAQPDSVPGGDLGLNAPQEPVRPEQTQPLSAGTTVKLPPISVQTDASTRPVPVESLYPLVDNAPPSQGDSVPLPPDGQPLITPSYLPPDGNRQPIHIPNKYGFDSIPYYHNDGTALGGELGILQRPGGGYSSELSVGVNDPRLNNGKTTNIPTLVKGQSPEDIAFLINTPVEEQRKHPERMHRIIEKAIERAVERVQQGQTLPSYDSYDQADQAAVARHEAEAQRIQTMHPEADSPPTETPEPTLLDKIRSTLADPISHLPAPPSSPTDRTTRDPQTLIEDLAAGKEGITRAEFNSILQAAEQGAFAGNSKLARRIFALRIPPDERDQLDNALTVGELVKSHEDRVKAIENKGPKTLSDLITGTGPRAEAKPGEHIFSDTQRTFLENLLRGTVLDTLSPASTQADTLTDENGLPSPVGQALKVEEQRRAATHPLTALGGELVGSLLPYGSAIKVLRGFTGAPETAGAIAREGAAVSAPLEFARKPEGEDTLTARAQQAALGVGLSAGADLALTKVLGPLFKKTVTAPLGKVLDKIHESRANAALQKEAEANGFDSVESYIASTFDIIDTPDGQFVRPRADVLKDFPEPGKPRQETPDATQNQPEPPPKPDQSTAGQPPATEGEFIPLEQPRPAEAGQPAGDTIDQPVASTDSGPAGQPDTAQLPAPGSKPAGDRSPRPRPSPAESIARSELAELDDLIGRTNHPAIRAHLENIRNAINKELDTRAKLTPKDRIARNRHINIERDDLITVIKKLGGLDVDLESDYAGRLSHLDRKIPGVKAIEQHGSGNSLDDLVERLDELGFLNTRDKQELESKLYRAEAGDKFYSHFKRDYGDEFAPEERPLEHRFENIDDPAASFYTYDEAGNRKLLDQITPEERARHDAEAPLPDDTFQINEDTGTLPGIEPKNTTRQGLLDKSAQVDSRLRGEGVPAKAKKDTQTNDLFSDESRQLDITDASKEPPAGTVDVFEPKDSQAPAPSPTFFGPRVRSVRTGTFPTGLRQVKSAADVAHVTAPLRKNASENFLTVVTDDQGNILRVTRLHIGDAKSANVDVASATGAALNTPGAKRVYFVHNHPTGDVTQSSVDHLITDKLDDILRGTGLKNEGMIVVGQNSAEFSHYKPGEIPEEARARITAARRNDTTPLVERKFYGAESPHDAVSNPETLRKAIRDVAKDREGVILFNNKNKPVAFVELSADELTKLRKGESGPSAKLLRAIEESNANGLATSINRPVESKLFQKAASNVEAFGKATNFRVLDHYDIETGRSFRETGGILTNQGTFYSNPFWQAGADLARAAALHPRRTLAQATAGAVGGATFSKEEPGSAKWWLDVAAGAGVSIGIFNTARAFRLLGKGSILDNAYYRLGEAIQKLPYIGSGPEQVRLLKNKQRVLEQLIDRQASEVGEQLLQRFTPAERSTIADLIENRGIIKDFNVIHRQAEALDNFIADAGERLKDLGVLPEELQTGGYLHRYYAKHLGLNKSFREAKRQSLSGSYTIARGTDDTFHRNYFSETLNDTLDELDSLTKRIKKLERVRPGLLSEDDATRLAELKAQREDLRKTELVEYVGEENGKTKSFLFRSDELPRVVRSDGSVLSSLHQPRPGEIDASVFPQARNVKNLVPTDRKWNLRGIDKDQVLLHRDWTKAERAAWGEITDAGYRFVRGLGEVSHDLSLGTLFKRVADRGDWTKSLEFQGPSIKIGKQKYVWVDEGKVGKGSPLRKYGALSGKYVRSDVWNGIRNYGRAPFAPGPIGNVYRALVNRWKLWKTVYNPVTHLNNTFSNVEMYYMAGYKPRHIAQAVSAMIDGENSQLWKEARDAGIFGTDWTSSILKTDSANKKTLEDIAERLRTQGDIPDAELSTRLVMDIKDWIINSRNSIRDADSVYKTGAELAKAASRPVVKGLGFIKRPIDKIAGASTWLYRKEDELFKLATFIAERKSGSNPEQAAIAAQRFFFDYSDLPEAVKIVRDLPIGSPFISYTYKAIPAIARNIVQNPERVLALVAAYEGLNYASLVMNDDIGPGEYWASVEADQAASPPWERGRSLFGALNTIHIPSPEGYRLSLGRAHALGNPFMSDAGGREVVPTVPYITNFWGSSIFGSSPVAALIDVAFNEDWKGRPIYEPGDPDEIKAKKSIGYLYQAWAPSNALTPGGYHQNRIIEGLANNVREDRAAGIDPGLAGFVVDSANDISELLGFGQFTGLDRADNPVIARDEMLNSFGVKIRPFRPEQSIDFELADVRREKEKAAAAMRKPAREASHGRITDSQLDRRYKMFDNQLKRAEKREDELLKTEALLRAQGRLR